MLVNCLQMHCHLFSSVRSLSNDRKYISLLSLLAVYYPVLPYTDSIACKGIFKIENKRDAQPVRLFQMLIIKAGYITTLIILPFTKMIFLGCLPSIHFCTASLANTAASISACAASSANSISTRALPLIATG